MLMANKEADGIAALKARYKAAGGVKFKSVRTPDGQLAHMAGSLGYHTVQSFYSVRDERSAAWAEVVATARYACEVQEAGTPVGGAALPCAPVPLTQGWLGDRPCTLCAGKEPLLNCGDTMGFMHSF